MTAAKRFKISKYHGQMFFKPYLKGMDGWHVNGGTISGEYYPAMIVNSKAEAQVIADARNRLVKKKRRKS